MSDEHARAVQLALNGDNLFITGPAGCGKSEIIRKLVENFEATGRSVDVAASTASAAYNLDLGASTLQSLFGFYEQSKVASSRWNLKQALIIDECSMVSPALFAKMDELARQARKSDEPMGGLQVILVGDFLQLPPVPNKTKEFQTKEEFIFEMSLWFAMRFKPVVLRTAFRQRDPRFAGILNRIRTGTQSEADVALLESNVPDPKRRLPTSLFSKNAAVDACNRQHLQGLVPKTSFEWKPVFETEGQPLKDLVDKVKNHFQTLVVRVGARVMLTANLSQKDGLVNGARGVVHSVVDSCPVVQFRDGRAFMIQPRKVVHELIGGKLVVVHMPLTLAWAMSIHKSQGHTLERVSVNCNDVCNPGQLYVALSRATSLAGIDVKGLRKSLKSHRSVSEKAVKFYEGLKIN